MQRTEDLCIRVLKSMADLPIHGITETFELKNNVKKAWWKKFIQENPYNVGVDCAILMNPQTWVASGHLGGFADPLMDCKECHERFRADKLIEDFCEEKGIERDMCINVDFYSGFVYQMLKLPQELYTPIFAMSRIVGWSAHRIEEVMTNSKIIRPAYKSTVKRIGYTPIGERERINLDEI